MVETFYSLDEITAVAKQIVARISEPVILFVGSMGAGKTTLIKAICHELGVKDEVSSPTFAIVNEYLDSQSNPIYHFDLYRVDDEVEAMDFGVEEYFDSKNICLIEWPEKIPNLLPEKFGMIKIEDHIERRKLNFFPNCTFGNMPFDLNI